MHILDSFFLLGQHSSPLLKKKKDRAPPFLIFRYAKRVVKVVKVEDDDGDGLIAFNGQRMGDIKNKYTKRVKKELNLNISFADLLQNHL